MKNNHMATETDKLNRLMLKKEEKGELHIAMFPWLAFGHMIPFLQLSKFLAKKGHKITFLSTPNNIDRLPSIPLSDSITLVKLPLPQVDGLPPNAEATMDIHPDDIPYLKKAYDALEPGLTLFLENSVPCVDLIICDFAPHWLPQAAAKLGIPLVFFCIFNAWFFSFLGPTHVLVGTDPRTKPEDFTVPPKWVPFDNKVAYRIYEINWIMESGKINVSGVSDIYRAGMVIKGCDAIIIRHSREFEGQWLNLLAELHQKPVIPLGLMPPEPEPEQDETETNQAAVQTWITAKKWLDNQNKGSVVYVALGSEVALSEEQVIELALGLESSGVPFFWVLRKPATAAAGIELPQGFEERVVKWGRGMVWKTWAPQLKILSHESVGGFLTHCGWSSIIEGLMLGLALIMLPFLVDQGLNARVLEDNELGMEVARNEEDGSYTKESVAECVRFVMVEKQGAKLREKARESSIIFGDSKLLHNHYLEDFSLMLSTSNNN